MQTRTRDQAPIYTLAHKDTLLHFMRAISGSVARLYNAKW